MKILLSGGTGLVGRNILEYSSAKNHEIYAPSSKVMNLLDYEQTHRVIAEFKPNLIIHAAGLVGGIQANKNAMFDFMTLNMAMGLNIVRAAKENNVERLINLGSTCMYPAQCPQPMKEEYLLTGPLEPTNEGYAIAKTAVQKACDYVSKEKGFQYKTYIPCNLFGKYDHFDPEKSHLLPAILRKIYEAKKTLETQERAQIEIWGTGEPRREFMDAADLASFIFYSLSMFDKVPNVINVSSGEDMRISDYYGMIALRILGKDMLRLKFVWNKDKPDGMMQKLSDISKIKALGWDPTVTDEHPWGQPEYHVHLLERMEKAYNYYVSLVEENDTGNLKMSTEKQKTAFITGVAGQDGSYLAEFLLSKGYRVVGMTRRNSQQPHDWLQDIFSHPNFVLVMGNMQDSNSLWSILSEYKPDEIYNLAAQSHVRVSFDCPEETFDVVAMGTLRLLNAAKAIVPNAKIYQAGSSEQFGFNPENPQTEKTVFMPASPYACAKVAAHNICVNYRNAYNMFISVGILHNHESPRRGDNFVTRKITRAAARIQAGLQDTLELGNLDAKRDWGFAKEYVEVMWLMLQQPTPDDFVISTGETHSVREFLEIVFEQAGLDVNKHVTFNSKYLRPHEVNFLWGDSSKAQKILGWKAQTKFSDLAKLMLEADMREASKEQFLNV